MPRDSSISKILLIGSGPIVIGQGCEFDYSGTQATKALKEEGYEIVLVNSNPATIMTDPDFSDQTYIEPLTEEILQKIIRKEKPDALLPTLGGQTALNLAMELHKSGFLAQENVRMIGANAEAINRGEDRQIFKDVMRKIGLEVAESKVAKSFEKAMQIAEEFSSFPLIIRAAFTLGGSGGGIAYNLEEFSEIAKQGISLSPVNEILIEESLLGWKEYEMEVIRDSKDQCVIICSIENIDPMGIHTGDSVTVAPAQTLNDIQYQKMRDASFSIVREIGVETGGSNIQFAIHPKTQRMVVIEMNPRVSRSSALASKATGFPIARIAAKLAVGFTLEELPNDITKETLAAFEPAIDYVVTKIPKFAFEKFPTADPTLTTQMKSVGEVMAIGATFKESFQKAVSSLENQGTKEPFCFEELNDEVLLQKLYLPRCERISCILEAFSRNWTLEKIQEATSIDPFFLAQFQELAHASNHLSSLSLLEAKKLGFSDEKIAQARGKKVSQIRKQRKREKIVPSYALVDTCAAEFSASTPYYYSTYGSSQEPFLSEQGKKVMILGSGPNRIGQGIEFDYCCVHASFALREMGFKTIMVNSNPETVSTDYDISDRLYFEPLSFEHVLEIYERENPEGIIVQFGGQTPLNLSMQLSEEGIPILGTSPQSIAMAEDREKFSQILNNLNLSQADYGIAKNEEQAIAIAKRIGYPVLVRPSFVLGGRAMSIVYSEEQLRKYIKEAVAISANQPILVDRFLEGAIEFDVDCISDGETTVVAGIMQHIERAGIHSGDSACVLPAFDLSQELKEEILSTTKQLAQNLNVLGLMNIQYAFKENELFVIEANPRASRTVPFVSKSIGIPLAKLATRVMLGEKLADLGFTKEVSPSYFCVKESVFPWARFSGVDTILGPEMKSTGEVMGIDEDLGIAYAKSQISAFNTLPQSGNVFVSIDDCFKSKMFPLCQKLIDLGFEIFATKGTYDALNEKNLSAQKLYKIGEQRRPNVLDMIKNNKISLVINVASGENPHRDEIKIRSTAIRHQISYCTTLTAAEAAIRAIESLEKGEMKIKTLQSYHSA